MFGGARDERLFAMVAATVSCVKWYATQLRERDRISGTVSDVVDAQLQKRGNEALHDLHEISITTFQYEGVLTPSLAGGGALHPLNGAVLVLGKL